MVQWSSAEENERDSGIFHQMTFAFFGVYVWEVFVTWDFEWSLLTGKRTFRWPLINCQALYTFNSWTGNMSILCASTSLMLRTIALWERRRSIVVALGILCVAHWAILYRTMFIVLAKWDNNGNACVVIQTSPSWLNTTFFFSKGAYFVPSF
ncbi:hypothetical protein BJ165DRAFT_1397659 [Panaeolus papilionaceus]|nr:hypothetical protein BJ165DRAFT_1397659 [Panaeolus papilionaceus]